MRALTGKRRGTSCSKLREALSVSEDVEEIRYGEMVWGQDSLRGWQGPDLIRLSRPC